MLRLAVVWLFTTILLSALDVGAETGASRKAVRTLLVPDRETVISSQQAGRILEIKERIGSPFKVGDILVLFDCDELRARLQMADADLESAQVSLRVKQELLELKSAGDVEVTLAKAAVEKAKAQVALHAASVKACVIKAPFDGSVTKVSARAHQSVNQGQPLLEIVSSSTPKARMFVPSNWLVWLKVGSSFNIKVDENGKAYQGQISAISDKVDAVSQTVEVEGSIESTQSLVAGMSGFASFVGRK